MLVVIQTSQSYWSNELKHRTVMIYIKQ